MKPSAIFSFQRAVSSAYKSSLKNNALKQVNKNVPIYNKTVYNYVFRRCHQTSIGIQPSASKNGATEANFIGLVFVVFLGGLSAKILVDSPLYCANKVDINSVKKDIIALIDQEDEKRADGTGTNVIFAITKL